MNFSKEYKLIIRPLLKASPVIIGLIAIAVLVTRRAVTYMTPEYRASGAIKINNLDYTQAAITLFDDQSEKNLPRQNENFLAEVEVFQTRDLIAKTLANLHWELTTYRVGKLRLSEIFEERPFIIDYGLEDESALDKTFFFDYTVSGHFRFYLSEKMDSSTAIIAPPGELVKLGGLLLSIRPDTAFLRRKPNSLRPGDRFALRLNSEKALIAHYKSDRLFVKPVDKEVSIIRIYFNHELPEKAQAFVNTLMTTYIEEGRRSRQQQLDETLAYLEEQIKQVKERLQEAEARLAGFRSNNQMLNTTQETDAVLRELTQLNLQKVNLEMKTSELRRLQQYLLSGNSLSDFSPNFEALDDPIFRSTYLKAQNYEEQRKDYLQKYTAEHPLMLNLDEKIREARAYLNESVMSTLGNLAQKNEELDSNIAEVNNRVERFPDKERQFLTLQRQVTLNEALYNYLVRRYTELTILRSSDLFPHKIIEHATRPSAIVSPNKSLYYGMGVLLALVVGMFYAYLRSYFKETVRDRSDLEERLTDIPILGEVYKCTRKTLPNFSPVTGLVANLRDLPLPPTKGQGRLFVVSSWLPGEGKTFTTARIAEAMAAMGYRVLALDLDALKPELHLEFDCTNEAGFCESIAGQAYALDLVRPSSRENLWMLTAGHFTPDHEGKLYGARALDIIHDLRWHFDIIVVDTAPLGVFDESVVLMRRSTANLLVQRVGVSLLRRLSAMRQTLDTFQIPNLYLVLDGVKPTAKQAKFKAYRRATKVASLIPNLR